MRYKQVFLKAAVHHHLFPNGSALLGVTAHQRAGSFGRAESFPQIQNPMGQPVTGLVEGFATTIRTRRLGAPFVWEDIGLSWFFGDSAG